jgi:hypothetical protein
VNISQGEFVKYVKCFQFEINSFITIERVIQFDNFRGCGNLTF